MEHESWFYNKILFVIVYEIIDTDFALTLILHDFNGGEERNIEELIKDTVDNPIIKGVTFSGGDPFERAEEFSYMAKRFKENNLNIWSYTGYTFEEILKNMEKRKGFKDLLNNIDVLVDGRFIEEEMTEGLKI